MEFDPKSIIKEINVQYSKLDVNDMENFIINVINMVAEKFGEESIGFASLLNELGGFYRTTSNYKKAEDIFVKAKNTIVRLTGKNDVNYATTINNLAGVYRLVGDFSKAKQLFLEAIEIYRNISMEDSFIYSSALNNLGLLYLDKKEYKKAASLFEKSNIITKKEKNSPVIYATGLGNLANAYLALGRTKDAEKMFLEAVEVYIENKLEGNLHFASAINSLGLFYFTIGDNDKAEQLFLQALLLKEKYFGSNNHEYAKVADNLSILYQKIGKPELAERYAAQASKAHKKIFEVDKSNETQRVTGMELALMSFAQFGVSTICRDFPEYLDRIAVGLVGEGSECYGFDDKYSQDHDWGSSFCIWLTKSDFDKIGSELQIEYDKITQNFLGYEMKNTNKYGPKRRGVFEINSFYREYIGLDRPPVTLMEWRAIPETNLSIVTNGKVFIDNLAAFSNFRNSLKAFYPDDIRLKKIAARCAIMAQAGQYNYSRSIKRMEYVAAQHAMASFIDATISVIFLLNKEYKPFYKWMHRALKGLPILGIQIHEKLMELASYKCGATDKFGYDKNIILIEEISQSIINELLNQNMSKSSSDFLLDHAYEVQDKIKDFNIKQIHIMAE